MSGGIAHATMKLGDSHVTLHAHGNGRASVTDQHGNTLHLGKEDIRPSGRGSSEFRRLMFHAPADMEHVGDQSFMTRLEDRHGKPFAVATAGLRKTHIAPDIGDDEESYLKDVHTFHIAPGGGVDDPADLFHQPGTTVSTTDLHHLAYTLESFAATSDRVDTGHGHVDMHVVGRDYTLDPGQRGAPPLVLTRGELRNVDKALSAAFEAYDPDEGPALPADQQFRRVIQTKHGEIVVTRTGPDGDFWIESDTTAVRVSPDRFHDFTYQLDVMLTAGSDLKHLTPAEAVASH